MTRLLALDPALGAPAWALFENRKLIDVCAVKFPSALRRNKNIADRQRLIAAAIYDSVPNPELITELTFERMQIYSKKRRGGGPVKKVDPDDLLKVATLAGMVCGRFNVPSSSPYPAEWLGGQSPKNYEPGQAWRSARGARARRSLSAAEFAIAGEGCSHDVLDAICIGLFELGRFVAADCRVYPGAV